MRSQFTRLRDLYRAEISIAVAIHSLEGSLSRSLFAHLIPTDSVNDFFPRHLFPPDLTKILPYEEVDRQTPAHALKLMDNNVAQDAQALKMARSTLYRKLKMYRLILPD